MSRSVAPSLLILIAAALAGCTSTGTAPAPAAVAPAATAQQLTGANTSEYRVAPYDILDVSVFQVKDLDSTVQVSETGKIILPLLGEVQAGGRTTKEIQRDITAKLSAKYLQSPLVSVTIKQAAAQSITVDGAVTKPGVFPLNGTVPLSQAVALGGGLNGIGSTSGVSVTRKTARGSQVTHYDLDQIRSGAAADPILIAGDIVTVPESPIKIALRSVGGVVAPAASSVGSVRAW